MAKVNISIARGRRLQNIRKKVGLTRLEFSEKTGISPNTLKSIELGERELSQQKALLYSNLFTSLFAMSLGKDAYEAGFEYLYYGKVTKSLDNNKVQNKDDEHMQNTINSFATNSAYLVSRVTDNLMSPFYNMGDIVCGRKVLNKNHFELFQGHICILEATNGDKLLRRVIKCEKHKITSCILNINTNQNLVEVIEVNSIAQTIWHWHLSELEQK